MSKFPAWRYGPGGESRVFESETAVPKGWRDTPYVVDAPAEDRNPLADDLKAAQDRAEGAEAQVVRLTEEIDGKNRTIATLTARVAELEAGVAKFDGDGDGKPGGSMAAPKPESAVEPDAPEPGAEQAGIEIPTDWADLHWTQRVKLAKAIMGGEGDLSADEAVDVIAEEVARRAAITSGQA